MNLSRFFALSFLLSGCAQSFTYMESRIPYQLNAVGDVLITTAVSDQIQYPKSLGRGEIWVEVKGLVQNSGGQMARIEIDRATVSGVNAKPENISCRERGAAARKQIELKMGEKAGVVCTASFKVGDSKNPDSSAIFQIPASDGKTSGNLRLQFRLRKEDFQS